MKKTFTVIALVLLAVSCNRYLDIKPYGQTIPETAEEFSALLHAHLDEIDYGEEVVMATDWKWPIWSVMPITWLLI